MCMKFPLIVYSDLELLTSNHVYSFDTGVININIPTTYHSINISVYIFYNLLLYYTILKAYIMYLICHYLIKVWCVSLPRPTI